MMVIYTIGTLVLPWIADFFFYFGTKYNAYDGQKAKVSKIYVNTKQLHYKHHAPLNAK